MKNIRIKYILLPILLITFSFSLKAQSVTGTVSDQTGPLPGANVVVKGTSNGTTTDFDGNYTLNNVGADDTLVFSYIGFTPQEVAVNGREVVNVNLQEDLQSLDEVIVVGYGTQSRATVTGAISSIGSDEINALPVATADQALQGRAAGLTVLNAGSPGNPPAVRIRGLGTVNNNDPLYVIDGVISQGLGNLNPNDIESINVLKDASTTAVYGSRGSNGVVMVTTKRGAMGETKISLDTYVGMQSITNRYDVLNTEQYLQYAQEAFGVNPTTAASASGTDTDWQDEIFQTGLMQNYNLSVSGGGESSNFMISGGYLDMDGAVIETGFQRASFRANSDFRLGDRLKIGESFSVAFNSQNPELQAGGRSLIEHAIKAAPYLPVYNPDNLGGFQGPSATNDGQDAENPVRIQTLGEAVNKSVTVNGNIYGEYEIIDGLKFKSQIGIEHRSFNNNRFIPSFNDDNETNSTHRQNFAIITKNSGTFQNVLLTNSLNYQTTFDDVHNFEALLLSEQTTTKIANINAESRNEITNAVEQLSNNFSNLNSNSEEIVRIGYLGRINYDYDDKYILAASIRRDGSSRFGTENRWGWFPSVAAGWNVAKEDFLVDSSVSNLKLRGSWGIVGNDNIGSYVPQATITQRFNYPLGGALAVGATPANIANPDLKWEETEMLNVGLDFGLFNDQFTASLEYFQNTSNGLLFNVPLSFTLGIDSGVVTRNVGSVENKGYELNLGYNDFEGDFTWSANLNLSTTENEVLELNGSGGGQIVGGGFEGANITRTVVGEPMFHFYGLETDGIYQTQEEVNQVLWQVDNDGNTQSDIQPGDVRYVDRNGDGAINDADRTVIGNPFPKVSYGLNITANYKNWDFTMFINGVAGNDIYNTNLYDLEGMPRLFNAGTAVLDRWTPTNPSNSVPRPFSDTNVINTAVSDRFVEDGSFTRLRNVSIGYTLPVESISEHISKMRIYISGQNLFTLTDYSGLDPEIGPTNVFGSDQRFELGIDRGNYPQPQSFLIGIQATF